MTDISISIKRLLIGRKCNQCRIDRNVSVESALVTTIRTGHLLCDVFTWSKHLSSIVAWFPGLWRDTTYSILGPIWIGWIFKTFLPTLFCQIHTETWSVILQAGKKKFVTVTTHCILLAYHTWAWKYNCCLSLYCLLWSLLAGEGK